ncbi:hypothetical protein BDN70DRAFT_136933 [Pholiota conissans]|uniref:Uncharacterized protein n=1 Tax=Pholiota conissans TaxID=109636 RepID=A0A9P6CXV5_9AGAR|nr:hypothetical protein BDN70DRAFT_136933 [Pholiota conissans]
MPLLSHLVAYTFHLSLLVGRRPKIPTTVKIDKSILMFLSATPEWRDARRRSTYLRSIAVRVRLAENTALLLGFQSPVSLDCVDPVGRTNLYVRRRT